MKVAAFGVFGSLALAALSAGLGAARAAGVSEYEIAANDGYGLSECLEAGAECGRVVADAWCEAHGHGHALAFGARASTRATRVAAVDGESYVVTCGD